MPWPPRSRVMPGAPILTATDVSQRRSCSSTASLVSVRPQRGGGGGTGEPARATACPDDSGQVGPLDRTALDRGRVHACSTAKESVPVGAAVLDDHARRDVSAVAVRVHAGYGGAALHAEAERRAAASSTHPRATSTRRCRRRT